MLGYSHIDREVPMSITDEEWNELNALKRAINFNPASVHWDKMEKFTELLVKSWSSESNESSQVNRVNNDYINSRTKQ